MPQLASLNNPPDEQGKNTSLDVPVGVPILTSEDFTWYIDSAPLPVTGVRTPTPVHIQGSSPPSTQPQFDYPRGTTASQPIESMQRENTPKLVRTLPYPSQRAQNNPKSLGTGTYRWEQQTSRYPAELLQIMESETREMQVLQQNQRSLSDQRGSQGKGNGVFQR